MSKKNEEKTASNGPVIDAADEREQIIDPSDIGASKRYRMPTVDKVPAEKEALTEKDKGGESGTGEYDDASEEALGQALALNASVAGQLLSRELSKTKLITEMNAAERERLEQTVEECVDLADRLVNSCARKLTKRAAAVAAHFAECHGAQEAAS